MQNSFSQQVVVVTGGTSGIGKALVARFLDMGALVATCARNPQKLEALANEFSGKPLFTYVADVSREAECRDFIEQTVASYGKINILINNAGMSMRALFDELKDLRVMKELMDINFWGSVYCTFYAMSYLKTSRGTVVGVSSVAGYRGLPGRAGYSASKFALQGFLEVLRTENLHSGMNIMWVSPGFTASNIRNTALNKDGMAQAETPLDEKKLMSAESVAAEIIKAITARKRTRVMTLEGNLAVWINKLFPRLADKLIYSHFKKEPGSPLK